MSLIYEPQGKAREYAPLSLNIYDGCDHGCVYCYVPEIKQKYNIYYRHNEVKIKKDYIRKLKTSVNKYYNTNKYVLLSFTGDPYCQADQEYQLTRQTLKILMENRIPTIILSKGGKRILRDLDIIRKFEHFQYATTLTFNNETDSLKYEPGAAIPSERIETLKIFHENKIETWVSIEPVIYPEQSINLIKKSLPFVDIYKIGKLNHYKNREKKINWTDFLYTITNILNSNNKKYYIKEDLRKYSNKEIEDINYQLWLKDLDTVKKKKHIQKSLF